MIKVESEIENLKLAFDHPNIVQLLEIYESPDTFHILTELLPGGELFSSIAARTRYTSTQSATAIRQILSAIAHLHTLGITHRDIKPENVIIDKDNIVKLIDFGYALRVGDS